MSHQGIASRGTVQSKSSRKIEVLQDFFGAYSPKRTSYTL